jgi:hypothetical protein
VLANGFASTAPRTETLLTHLLPTFLPPVSLLLFNRIKTAGSVTAGMLQQARVMRNLSDTHAACKRRFTHKADKWQSSARGGDEGAAEIDG